MQPIGLLTLDRQPDELLRRDRAGRLPRRPPGARHRRHRRPAAAGAAVLLRRHPAHPARRPELQPDPDQPAARPGQRHAPRRLPPARRARRASRRTGRTRSTAAARSSPAGRGRRVRRRARPRSPRRPRSARSPASFDDHFSQARQFWLSMTPVEQEHIVLAYTFELAKCYEQAIKERQLLALANIDPDLCAQVADRPRAAGPGADRGPGRRSTRARPCRSSATPGRPTGGTVGIVVDPTGDLAGVDDVRRPRSPRPAWCRSSSPRTAASCPTAPPVQRTFAATRSVEFDAVLLAGSPAPAPDASSRATARPARTARRCSTRASCCCSRSASGTPRRSAPGAPAWTRSSSPGSRDAPGVVTGDDPADGVRRGPHRCWARTASGSASTRSRAEGVVTSLRPPANPTRAARGARRLPAPTSGAAQPAESLPLGTRQVTHAGGMHG